MSEKDPIRLSLFLSRSGLCSRRKADELIESGRVCINGKTVLTPHTRVEAKDKVTVGKKRIRLEEKAVYLALNKPKGYVCSAKPFHGQKSVLKLLPQMNALRVFTIGRLDKDTTGLLLITNDGAFAQKVIHPSSKLLKEYLIKTVEETTEEQLECLRKGIRIENDFVQPVKVQKVRKGTIKIVIREGKKRQVRQIVAAAGLTLLELTRIRIGNLQLGTLPEGAYRHLTENEKRSLLQEDKS